VRKAARRRDADGEACSRSLRARLADPAVWAWMVVALLALLPLRAVVAGA
jgi:hypothetical protein